MEKMYSGFDANGFPIQQEVFIDGWRIHRPILHLIEFSFERTIQWPPGVLRVECRTSWPLFNECGRSYFIPYSKN